MKSKFKTRYLMTAPTRAMRDALLGAMHGRARALGMKIDTVKISPTRFYAWAASRTFDGIMASLEGVRPARQGSEP